MNAVAGQPAISHPFTAPDPAVPVEVAPGILWVRVPFAMPPGHVNALVLDDGDGWTVVDPGMDTAAIRAQWEALLTGPLAGRPVRRVVVTHHHLDHIGMAGWFTARGGELVTTRTAYLLARMLVLDRHDVHPPEMVTYWRRAGLSGEALEQRTATPPWNMADATAPLPSGYTRLIDGQSFRMAGRDWTLRMGHGHAPEHATFWTDDVVIGGDQLLPGISPNLGAWATEPEADPVGDWLESCTRLAGFATESQLVLPGHKLPYRGLPFRLDQMERNHRSALKRLEAALVTPTLAIDCFSVLFGRAIGGGEFGLALAEALGHLNHLHQTGRVTRRLTPDGAWLWQAVSVQG